MKQLLPKSRYWKNLDELEEIAAFQERTEKEFPEPPAKQHITSMERRSFLKLMGASAIAASFACSRRPVEKIIPYVNKPEEITPGVANWYASTCGSCSAGCGILVKTREGRPIKIEGNPDHPLNRGGLCARGQASLLDLYNPARLKRPATVARSDGSRTEVSWSEIDEEIRGELKGIAKTGGKVVLLTGAITSQATISLIQTFLSQFRQGEHIAFEGVVPEEIGIAQELSYGTNLTPCYRFDQAELILSFGADFLGTWLSPVEFAKGFSKGRRVDEGRMSRFIALESSLSLTGTNADEHMSVAPGDELLAALAIAHELIVEQGHSAYAGNVSITQVLAPYGIDVVSKKIGIEAQQLRNIVEELWSAREKGLVVGGAVKAKGGVQLQVVTNLLNSALLNDGVTVDWRSPSHQAMSSSKDLVRLAAEMKQGNIAALLIGKGDPLFVLPQELEFASGLKKIPLVINFSDQLGETSRLSTHLCPDTHPLESWNDAHPQEGLFSIVQPVIAPLYDNRSFQDSLIAWGVSQEKNWHSSLQSFWRREISNEWETALKEGFVDRGTSDRHREGRIASVRTFRINALQNLPPVEPNSNSLKLALTPSLTLYDGRSHANSWLQELPDPISKITWENYISIAPSRAKELGIHEGDVLEVSSQQFKAKLPAHLQPMLHPDTIIVAVGYGQIPAPHIGHRTGIDVYPFQTISHDFLEWSGIGVQLVKTREQVKLAVTAGHHDMMGRPIIFETTWEEFKKNPSSGIDAHHDTSLTMWEKREYKKERWGMVIDLNSCTGCSACVIGCQAENNIPVVGRDQVVKGREMHWLRIDRYYSGNADAAEVANQPMLCQQCENAPCETVCPVLATFHSDDGLNMMTYNRCVGTRYCSNNCPYKVRRFNYFGYAEEIPEPINLVLNPDVTARSRGVMEKCTFCIQRIQEKRQKADMEGRPLQDGEIQTACQQSCPGEVIVFGDLNDSSSRVAKLARSQRGYHVLADLNTRPSVTYLTKVRNRG